VSYASTEERIQTLLQGLTSVFATTAQVTRGDWRPLDTGIATLAVLYPGEFREAGMTRHSSSFHWTINLEFFLRFSNTAYTDFGSKRDAILQHLQKYPTLNVLGNANREETSGGDIREVFDKDGNGPFFLSQVISIRVADYIQVTIAET
jgi:hypothetical protein